MLSSGDSTREGWVAGGPRGGHGVSAGRLVHHAKAGSGESACRYAAMERLFRLRGGGMGSPKVFASLTGHDRQRDMIPLLARSCCHSGCERLDQALTMRDLLQNKEGAEDRGHEDGISMMEDVISEAKKQALREEMERQMRGEADKPPEKAFTVGKSGESIFQVQIRHFQLYLRYLVVCLAARPVQESIPERGCRVQVFSRFKEATSLEDRKAQSKKIIDTGKGIPVIGTAATTSPDAPFSLTPLCS